ncbi:hypothetical protein Drorol1_Dr00020527 [Drosera rotundifolia]
MSVSSSLSISISSESLLKGVPVTSGVNVANSSSDQSPLVYTGGIVMAQSAGVRTRSSHQAGTSAAIYRKDLIDPDLQRAAGLRTGNVPVDASSSSPGSSGSSSCSSGSSPTSVSSFDSGGSFPAPSNKLPMAADPALPSFSGDRSYTLRLDEESGEIFVDVASLVGEIDQLLPPDDTGNRGATSTGTESPQMPKTTKGSLKRKFGLEHGEITPPRRADKLPRIDDPPPPVVTKIAKTPKKLAGYATRNQPREKETFETRHSPELTGLTRRHKRLAGS